MYHAGLPNTLENLRLANQRWFENEVYCHIFEARKPCTISELAEAIACPTLKGQVTPSESLVEKCADTLVERGQVEKTSEGYSLPEKVLK